MPCTQQFHPHCLGSTDTNSLSRVQSAKNVMSNQLVVFALDAQHYALPLTGVQRVVRMVEVTPLPKAPEIVLGVIDVKGHIIPVMSIRNRFGLPEPETNLSD